MARNKSFSDDLMFGIDFSNIKESNHDDNESVKKGNNNIDENKAKDITEQIEDSERLDETDKVNETIEEPIEEQHRKVYSKRKVKVPQIVEMSGLNISEVKTNTLSDIYMRSELTDSKLQKKLYMTKKQDEIIKNVSIYLGITTSKFIRDAIMTYLDDYVLKENPDIKKLIEINLQRK